MAVVLEAGGEEEEEDAEDCAGGWGVEEEVSGGEGVGFDGSWEDQSHRSDRYTGCRESGKERLDSRIPSTQNATLVAT